MIALLLFSLPFQDITLPNGSFASYVVDCGNPNKGAVGGFTFMPSPQPSGLFQQALVKGDKG